MRLLTIILLILVILLLAILFCCPFRDWFCQHARVWLPAKPCSICAASPEGHAKLEIEQLGVSIWKDGTVAIAVPIRNVGDRGAGDVHVNNVQISGGVRTLPATLPVALGEMFPLQRGVVQTTFSSLGVPGTYKLTVAGTYYDRGQLTPFTADVPLQLQARAPGPFASTPGSVNKQKTSGVAGPPHPVHPEVDETNTVGPPIPLGPRVSPFTVAPNNTPVSHAPPAGGSAAGIKFYQDTASNNGINNAPPDPSTVAASAANVVVDTDNTIMSYSVDGGATFTQLDPTTIFPQSDGGMCCDQVVLYDKKDNLIFWLQQYNSGSGSSGTNRERVAWASPESVKSNPNAWTYADLTQQLFNSGGGLDYPDLALSNNYLWVSVDGTDKNGKNAGLIVARLSLSDIVGSSGTVNLGYFGPNESTDQTSAHGSHLAQNSTDGGYWAGGTDSSDMEVFHWPDSSGNVTTNTTSVNNWCTSASDYANLPPDGMQWPDTGHLGGAGNIVAATLVPGILGGNAQVWFGWGAGADGSDCSQSGRSRPFVKIVKVDVTSLNSVGEYHIWNSAYAFSYPALNTDPIGNIGVSVAYAGPSDYPSSTVGYLGDYVVYYVEASTVSLKFYIYASGANKGSFTFTNPGDGSLQTDSSGNPIVFTRYGDYFSVRNSGSDGSLFSNQGYAVSLVDSTKSTTCLTTPGCTYHPHYEQWGRPPGPPIR